MIESANRTSDVKTHNEVVEAAGSQIPDLRPDALDRLTRLRADKNFVADQAAAWLGARQELLSTYPRGAILVVDLMTENYVVGNMRLEAMDAFVAEFGLGRTVGWLHQVGGPIIIGGGLAKG